MFYGTGTSWEDLDGVAIEFLPDNLTSLDMVDKDHSSSEFHGIDEFMNTMLGSTHIGMVVSGVEVTDRENCKGRFYFFPLAETLPNSKN